MQYADERALSVDAPIARAWRNFGLPAGKQHVNLAQLLKHTSGLGAALPKRARLKRLLDCEAMERHVAAAALAEPEHQAATADFEGAPWGWAIAGLLRALSGGASLPTLLSRRLTELHKDLVDRARPRRVRMPQKARPCLH